MDTAPLKAFATKARADLIKEVAGRLSVVLAENSLARVESVGAVRALEAAVARDGSDRVIDRVAYTWFNRFIALRFMDANGYTASGVVSPAGGQLTGQPEVLAEAKAGVFDSAVVPARVQETITALFNGTRASQDRDGEAYGLLLEAYCRSWNEAMPFMFEREGDYTELLIPTALLAAESVRDRAVKTLTVEVCQDVEVIGWLYQFYISERKDEVFAGFKKNKKAGAAEIPAATQLFTPHWIVRYLVENSLGRLWLLNNPTSSLAEQMEYYIKPVDEETEFLQISTPEELKIIDPAVGSGHMLTYAFDLLYAIYTERGYDPAEIPGLILQHNLHGTEIDPRAGALAAFALTMKAAARRKLFLKSPVQPNICVLENIHFDPDELDYLWSLTKDTNISRADADEFWNAFQHADTFGSLIQPNLQLIPSMKPKVDYLEASGNLLGAPARRIIQQAELLGAKYDVVVTNPPYMGGRGMESALSDFARREFPTSKADLYAMFIERSATLCRTYGHSGMITMQSWMFLGTYQVLRERLLSTQQVLTMAHLGSGAFDSIGGEVVATTAFVVKNAPSMSRGAYIGLVDLHGEASQSNALRQVAKSADLDRLHPVSAVDFGILPTSSMAYWLSGAERAMYRDFRPLGDLAEPRVGIQTGDNERFLRYWWEVSANRICRTARSDEESIESGARWFPVQKGGTARRWVGNDDHVVNWENGGEELRAFRPKSVIRNPSYYFRAGATWSTLSGEFAMRYSPVGSLFETKGSVLFPRSEDDIWWLLGYMNTPVARELIDCISPTLDYHEGPVSRMPVIIPRDPGFVSSKVKEALEAATRIWGSVETSPGYVGPNGNLQQATRVEDWLAMLNRDQVDLEDSILAIEREIEHHFRESGGLSDDVFPLARQRATGLIEADRLEGTSSGRMLVRDLVSFAVGCMFGRYSLDEPGPILADQGSTIEDFLQVVSSPSFMPDEDNVIPVVDGDWFEDDIVARFRQFLRVAFGEDYLEENLRFIATSLGVMDIRDYFVGAFYDDHVKRYKKRPIYWMFRSPKGSFGALVYLHRYGPSTPSTVLTGYLREYIGKLDASLDRQSQVAAGLGSASPRDVAAAGKEADRIRKVLLELREYEREVLFPLAGKQIVLDLDDGVLANYPKLGSALRDIGLKQGSGDE